MRRPLRPRARRRVVPDASAGAMTPLALDRRGFLKLTALALSAPLLGSCGMESAEDPGARWMGHGRIAGQALDYDPDADLGPMLDQMVRAGVSVIEGDSSLSDYLTEADFRQALRHISVVSDQVHRRNLKLVWYYPCLEVLSLRGEDPSVPSMFKEHPDWVQYSIDGKPNVFFGGKAFWVDPGVESAWMCPNSPYRCYFYDRLRRLAASGVDALWLDVPIFFDQIVLWCCASSHCRDRFRCETGLQIPAVADWTNPAWRRWIAWRHEDMYRFCRGAWAAVKEGDPRCEVVFETVSMDHGVAALDGLDGAFDGSGLDLMSAAACPDKGPGCSPPPLLPAPGTDEQDPVMRVWEVDAVSEDYAMKPAAPDDWLCLIRMFKFARGADQGRPTWIFCYGFQELDAGLVMSIAVATGCNPYETRTPRMTETVGGEFRGRMFRWIQAHKELLYDARPEVRVGVLHSSASRDYLDQGRHAAYTTYSVVDPGYWLPQATTTETALSAPYMGDYTGVCKALSNLHVPFVTVPIQSMKEASLAGLQVLLCPSLQSISHKQVEMLGRFVDRGGSLLITGAGPMLNDQLGTAWPTGSDTDQRIDQLLGFNRHTTPLPAKNVHRPGLGQGGTGTVTFYSEALGVTCLTGMLNMMPVSQLAALAPIRDVTGLSADPILEVTAHANVHVEFARLETAYVLHAINYSGAASPYTPSANPADETNPLGSLNNHYPHKVALRTTPQAVTARVPLLRGAPKQVYCTSPDREFKDGPIGVGADGSFTFTVYQYTMAIIYT